MVAVSGLILGASIVNKKRNIVEENTIRLQMLANTCLGIAEYGNRVLNGVRRTEYPLLSVDEKCSSARAEPQ